MTSNTYRLKKLTKRHTKRLKLKGGNHIKPTVFPSVIVMYDPDAPVSKKKGKSWLHYLRIYETADKYKDIVPYMPPSPPKGSGVHHYITEVYKLNNINKLLGFNLRDRSNFSITNFRSINLLIDNPIEYSEFIINAK